MVDFLISVEDVASHHFQVELRLERPQAGQCFSLPVWIPGSYLVREFSRHLSSLRAEQQGQPVKLRQLSKNRWQAENLADEPLVLRYRVYAFDSSVRAAYLAAERGFFNPSSLCLRAEGFEAQPQRLTLAGLPEGWEVGTALAFDGRCYMAADYDELVDHPFELGRFWRGQFEVEGVPHEFIVAGALPVFDGDRLIEDTRRLCAAQIAFWHGRHPKRAELPFQRYVFMLNAVEEGYGGLEHRASTALIAARRDLPRLGSRELGDGQVRLLGLISHEYFHSWNVKRLRPVELARYDYDAENYTELLWFFEGFTSYYDELFLVRSGLVDEGRYLKLLATAINGMLATPGRKVQSLAEASFEAWTKYYRPDENTPNATVSYYGKGALVGLALDLSLRSSGQASLDEVMRLLWQRSGGGPVSETQILDAVAELGGPAAAEELRQWVHGREDPPLASLLDHMGVHWAHEPVLLEQKLGLKLGQGLQIKQVLAGGAAAEAGLCAGDELLACNGWRLRKLDEIPLLLDTRDPLKLNLLLAREQRVLSLSLNLPPATAGQVGAVGLTVADKVAARAQTLRHAWLGA
ncbi:PDZ domain-containing protein [Pelomonas sp. SE-A7]|uniref:M61 family metallopeptidase n=1 Tax=Pelomonas sp. SE-A7 TaxID=3054953 RepID=UPI00259D305C|nr:PDZ domain-containing protein [Pelomonas sp. SE-A7]MDM4767569.1 PDZ domain-containing protein [Pelomonas sp. SE-A7]